MDEHDINKDEPPALDWFKLAGAVVLMFFIGAFIMAVFGFSSGASIAVGVIGAVAVAALTIYAEVYTPIETRLEAWYGEVNPALICPHCQTKGMVRTTAVERKRGTILIAGLLKSAKLT